MTEPKSPTPQEEMLRWKLLPWHGTEGTQLGIAIRAAEVQVGAKVERRIGVELHLYRNDQTWRDLTVNMGVRPSEVEALAAAFEEMAKELRLGAVDFKP